MAPGPQQDHLQEDTCHEQQASVSVRFNPNLNLKQQPGFKAEQSNQYQLISSSSSKNKSKDEKLLKNYKNDSQLSAKHSIISQQVQQKYSDKVNAIIKGDSEEIITEKNSPTIQGSIEKYEKKEHSQIIKNAKYQESTSEINSINELEYQSSALAENETIAYRSQYWKYLINEQKRNPDFKLERWQDISIKRDIRQSFHLGQVLGMGSYGVIREAVYKPAVEHHFANCQSLQAQSNQFVDRWDYTICQQNEIISVFDNPMFETYAIKTIRKSQMNINDEILNLIAIQQEIHKDRDDSVKPLKSKSSGQIQYCVKLYDIFEDQDNAHLVMEYCEGDTLEGLFDNNQSSSHEERDPNMDTLYTDSDRDPTDHDDILDNQPNWKLKDERSFKRVMRQLLYFVKCIHDIGIVHRDLKLSNIMIKNQRKQTIHQGFMQCDNQSPQTFGELRIIDFGLSTKFHDENGSLIQLKDMLGTPQYLAPEILSGSYDEKCDIWSLGIIAYQMFSKGKFPFNGFNEEEIFKKAKRGKFYLPQKNLRTQYSGLNEQNEAFDWNTMMSEEAKDFVRHLLCTNPKKRPSALQAIQHPWLNFESIARSQGKAKSK